MLEKEDYMDDHIWGLDNFRKLKIYIASIFSELGLDKDLPSDLKISIIASGDINAEALTYHNKPSEIRLTLGLIKRTTRGELMGVIGHEAEHILNPGTGWRTEENSCDINSAKRLLKYDISPQVLIDFFRRLIDFGKYEPGKQPFKILMADAHSPLEQRIRYIQTVMGEHGRFNQLPTTVYADTVPDDIASELDTAFAKVKLADLQNIEPQVQDVEDQPITRLYERMIEAHGNEQLIALLDGFIREIREFQVDFADKDKLSRLNRLVDFAYTNLHRDSFIRVYRAATYAIDRPYWDEHSVFTESIRGSSVSSHSRKKSDTLLYPFSIFNDLKLLIKSFTTETALETRQISSRRISQTIADTTDLVTALTEQGLIIDMLGDEGGAWDKVQRALIDSNIRQQIHQDGKGDIARALWTLGFFRDPKAYHYNDSLNKLTLFADSRFNLGSDETHAAQQAVWDKMYEVYPDYMQIVMLNRMVQFPCLVLGNRLLMGVKRDTTRPLVWSFSADYVNSKRDELVSAIAVSSEQFRQEVGGIDFSDWGQYYNFIAKYAFVFHVSSDTSIADQNNFALGALLSVLTEQVRRDRKRHENSIKHFIQWLPILIGNPQEAVLDHRSLYVDFLIDFYQGDDAALSQYLFQQHDGKVNFKPDSILVTLYKLTNITELKSPADFRRLLLAVRQRFVRDMRLFRDAIADAMVENLPIYTIPHVGQAGLELIEILNNEFAIVDSAQRSRVMSKKIKWSMNARDYENLSTEDLVNLYFNYDYYQGFSASDEKAFVDEVLLKRFTPIPTTTAECVAVQRQLHKLLMQYDREDPAALFMYSVSDIRVRKQLIAIWARNTREFQKLIPAKYFLPRKLDRTDMRPDLGWMYDRSDREEVENRRERVAHGYGYAQSPDDPREFLTALGLSSDQIDFYLEKGRWGALFKICELYLEPELTVKYILNTKGNVEAVYLLAEFSEVMELQSDDLAQIKAHFDESLQSKHQSRGELSNLDVLNTAADLLLRQLSEDEALRQITLNFLIDPVTFSAAESLRQQIEERFSRDQYLHFEHSFGSFSGTKEYRDKTIAMHLFNFHNHFHMMPIEQKAVALAQLLIPSKAAVSEESYIAAYQEAQKFVLDRVFSSDNSALSQRDRELGRSFVTAYLQSAEHYTNELLLAALLSASHDHGGSQGQMRLGELIKGICAHMGPAYVKLAQAIQSHPFVDAGIKQDLKDVKAKVGMPYRWNLVDQIQSLDVKVIHFGRIKGAASYNIAMQVTVEIDGRQQQVILLLQRDNAHQQAIAGIAHLEKALHSWQEDGIDHIRKTLLRTIRQTAAGLEQETNVAILKELEQVARSMYEGVVIDGYVIEPMLTRVWGDGYRLIDLAQGEHFNDLPADEQASAAKAILTWEWINLLRGWMDADRHGAQVRAIGAKLGYFDWGELPRQKPTQQELADLAGALPYMLGDSFAPILGLQIPTFNDYVRMLEQHGKQVPAFVTRAYRGVLAQQDYIQHLDQAAICDVLTTIQHATDVEPGLLQALQQTLSNITVELLQTVNPVNWWAAIKLKMSTYDSTPSSSTVKKPTTQSNQLGSYDPRPFDELVLQRVWRQDPYTQGRVFTFNGFKDGREVGTLQLLGDVEVCRNKAATDINVISAKGVFEEMTSAVNISQLAVCKGPMPYSYWEMVRKDYLDGFLSGLRLGIFQAVGDLTEKYLKPYGAGLAKVAGVSLMLALTFCASLLLDQEDEGWVAVLMAAMETGSLAVFMGVMKMMSLSLGWCADKAEARDCRKVARATRVVDRVLSVAPYAFQARQKGLYGIAASIFGGVVGGKAVKAATYVSLVKLKHQ
jgi:hypothetical protein